MATPSSDLSDVPDRPTGGERFIWFTGGLVVALHLVVLIGLLIASRSDSVTAGGDTGTDAGSAATSEVIVATEFNYAIEPGDRSGGTYDITLKNDGAIFHNLVIEEVRGFVIEAEAGASGSGSVDLDDGTYTLFCSVPGHRDAGMEALLAIGGP